MNQSTGPQHHILPDTAVVALLDRPRYLPHEDYASSGHLYSSAHAPNYPYAFPPASTPRAYLSEDNSPLNPSRFRVTTAKSYPDESVSLIDQFRVATYTDESNVRPDHWTRRICHNCRATASGTWRRSILTTGKILCNKCGLFERTHNQRRPHIIPPRGRGAKRLPSSAQKPKAEVPSSDGALCNMLRPSASSPPVTTGPVHQSPSELYWTQPGSSSQRPHPDSLWSSIDII